MFSNSIVAPQHITSLATSGILISVDVSVWTGQKKDKRVQSEVASDKGADTDAISVSKNLLSKCPQHKALMVFRQTINNGLNTFTFPWAGNLDYLPMVRYQKFMEWFSDRQAEHAEMVQDFKRVYPQFVSDLAFGVSNTLGSMFDRSDYPHVDELDSRFTLSLTQVPVPQNDWRVQVSHDLANDLHNHYERQSAQMAQRMVDEQSVQLIKVMESLKHSCDFSTVTDKDGNVKVKRNKVVESTLLKAFEMIDTFKSFNPSNSTALEEARSDLEKLLTNVTIDQLREHDTTRAIVNEKVGDILSKFRVGA